MKIGVAASSHDGTHRIITSHDLSRLFPYLINLTPAQVNEIAIIAVFCRHKTRRNVLYIYFSSSFFPLVSFFELPRLLSFARATNTIVFPAMPM